MENEPQTAYQLLGIQDVKYREKTFAEYGARIRSLGDTELDEYAREARLWAATALTRDLLIEKLECEYLRNNPEQVQSAVRARQQAEASEWELPVADRAAAIMRRAL